MEGIDMPLITALAISIGVLGGIATWAFVGPLAAVGLQIWAAFVAWGAYYHSGGKEASLKTNIPAHIWGALLAWASLLATLALANALGLPIAAGICVGIGVVILVFGANMPLLAQIPSAVYGFASVAAFALLGAGNLDKLTSASIGNPLINIIVSMVIGALLGWVSEKIAGALVARRATA
jgi:hypothetical protein